MINYSNLSVDALAVQEILEIFEWYEKKKDGLGEDFYKDLDETFKRILRNPEAFVKLKKHGNIRRIILDRFPYKIFYDATTNPVRIIAIIHFSRSAKYAGKRIK